MKKLLSSLILIITFSAQAKRQAVQLFFIRTFSDNCEANNSDAYFPNGIVLSYTFDELGIIHGQNVYVGNPFGR